MFILSTYHIYKFKNSHVKYHFQRKQKYSYKKEILLFTDKMKHDPMIS